MRLNDSITTIKGIGEKTALLFSKASVFCVNDLLHYFPRDYVSLPSIDYISNIKDGQYAVIQAKVTRTPVIVSARNGKRILNFKISDGTGELKVSYFNMPYLKNQFIVSNSYIFYGIVRRVNSEMIISNPKILSLEDYNESKDTLISKYPLYKGLNNKLIQKSIKAITSNDIEITDYLDDDIKTKNNLMGIKDALIKIHFPSNIEEAYAARRRLAFDEFFLFMIKINALKADKGKIVNKYPIKSFELIDNLTKKLPYALTSGQKNALNDIKKDMSSEFLMNRLIQGDVGCGKTIIAVLACLLTINNGFQAVIMAPTEVLARQHYTDVLNMISDYSLNFVKPALLVGSIKKSEKNTIHNDIKEGNVNLIIGTHALIQDSVEYKNLALAVTDEQHRFGVKQRMHLMNSGSDVNVLVLSATPIPRTLGLVLYGDMDVSVIKDLPSNRLPIKNSVIGEHYRNSAYKFMYNQIKEGRQVYVICPMVEEGELENVENVIDYSERLATIFPPEISIGTLHGKLKPAEKDVIMNEFKENRINILVSTTVVEVGVNVPNATVMLIENAERFGLASLHQLRGRVGRGDKQSYCMFMCGTDSTKAMKKLEILGKSNDGFEIASEDLKNRGPGDLFGIKQSGLPEFKVADIYTNSDVLSLARNISEEYISRFDKDKINTLVDKIDNSNVIDFHSVCL